MIRQVKIIIAAFVATMLPPVGQALLLLVLMCLVVYLMIPWVTRRKV